MALGHPRGHSPLPSSREIAAVIGREQQVAQDLREQVYQAGMECLPLIPVVVILIAGRGLAAVEAELGFPRRSAVSSP